MHQKRCLSFLPWAHAYAQTCELNGAVYMGIQVGLAKSLETVKKNLLDLEPDVLIAVPSLFSKIYDGISTRVAQEGPTVEKIFLRAV